MVELVIVKHDDVHIIDTQWGCFETSMVTTDGILIGGARGHE